MNKITPNINETELFTKYKSSYTSACADFSLHTALMSCTFYLMWYLQTSWLSALLIPILSFFLNRTFIVFHDCCHNSYSPSPTLNYILSHVTGIFVCTSPNWILDHQTHHLTNGNVENKQHYFFNETVLLTKNQFFALSANSKRIFQFYKHPYVFFSIVPLLYFGIAQRFIYIVKKLRHPKTYSQSLRLITVHHIVNTIGSFQVLYTIYQLGFLYHYIICLCFSASLSFMMFHNQHSYNPAYVVNNETWTQKDSGLKGSAYTNIPYFFKYFFMGIEYHHIHHMNAKIPGYNLQRYHEEVVSKSDAFHTVHTISFYEFFQNLWLFVYDTETNKFITYKELHTSTNTRRSKDI